MASAYAKALPRNMVDEAKEYQRLYREHLTTTGTLKWKSLSSGEEYTSTTGQTGIFRLLAFALRDYIISLDTPTYDKLGEVTASGTWTVPTGVNFITAFLITGGKSGYSAPWTDVLLVENMAVTPGDSITCVVGEAGGDVASRTTKFGTYEIAPTTLTYNDMTHFYCAYDNVFYCPYKITDDMFPDEMALPLDQYPIRYPTTPGASGFVGADGGQTDEEIGDTESGYQTKGYVGRDGGSGYIGGDGGDCTGMILLYDTNGYPLSGVSSGDYYVISKNTAADTNSSSYDPSIFFAKQNCGNGGAGHANGQGGDGGNAYTDTKYPIYPSAIGTDVAGGAVQYILGRGGDGGDGGNGGDGGYGQIGGNGGNALRYGGTGGSGGAYYGGHITPDWRNYVAGYAGTDGEGMHGAILIFTEHRETEA